MATMSVTELLSAIGFPARIVGRLLLVGRYIYWRRDVRTNNYALQRFGPSYPWRPWLQLDIKELADLEELINDNDGDKIEAFRSSQLSMCGMIGVMVRN